MMILVAGASGATGRLFVKQLLDGGHKVKAVVRSAEKFAEIQKDHKLLTVISASILELTDTELAELVTDCDAVASCLGHNLTWKGIYGQPRRLVSDTVRRLCDAIITNNLQDTTRFVLMNTAGNRNRDLNEQISFIQRCIIGLIRLLLPPQVDNEQAADYLRTSLGQSHHLIGWVVVRPDTLIDQENITEYDVYPSPIRSAIFNPGKTSRINVGHFMAELITDDLTWNKWKGQMPVMYNSALPE